MCNRLVTISWDDWSTDVRVAAAQALGRTGQAKVSKHLLPPLSLILFIMNTSLSEHLLPPLSLILFIMNTSLSEHLLPPLSLILFIMNTSFTYS